MLGATSQPLAALYDMAMFDLDGVVYIGGRAVPRAPEAIADLRRRGVGVAYVTNNASRSPGDVAQRLTALGVPATADDVVTSAQAAAKLLRERLAPGAKVWTLGAGGLVEAVRAEGLEPVDDPDAEPAAVVTGYGPQVQWAQLMRAAVAIRDGLPWVASNSDLTIPTGYGVAPGHGVQVRMLAAFAGVEPRIAGKPEGPLLRETIDRVGGTRPLMIGDRLDTDILGGRQAGVDTLLVLTGVTGLTELIGAPVEQRPTYISPDLSGLALAHPAPERTSDGWRLQGWSGDVRDGRLELTGTGPAAAWWAVAACAGWSHLDSGGPTIDIGSVVPPAADLAG